MTPDPRASGGATSQAAARLLVIMDRLGEPPSQADLVKTPGSVKVVRALSRLAKLDFWMRNPDYLADELLTDIEGAGLDPKIALPHVDRMLSGSAPTLHLYPMQRYKYGAWELPDNAISMLKLHGFATHKRAKEVNAAGASQSRRDYFLLEPGEKALGRMREEVEQLDWYDKQADAIAMLAVGPTGSAARERQYLQPEYSTTPIGGIIAPILDRVRERYETVAAAVGVDPSAAHEPAPTDDGKTS